MELPSITALRVEAESLGIPFNTATDIPTLSQLIASKKAAVVTPPPPVVNITDLPPERMDTTQEEALTYLAPYLARGLTITFPDALRWQMRYGLREDSGVMAMPLRVLLDCAKRMLA